MNEVDTKQQGSKTSPEEAREHELSMNAKRIMEVPSNWKKRLDYDVRTDDNPVYVGFAPWGMDEGNVEGWLLYKMTYDGSDRITEVDIAYDSWTNHATAVYS